MDNGVDKPGKPPYGVRKLLIFIDFCCAASFFCRRFRIRPRQLSPLPLDNAGDNWAQALYGRRKSLVRKDLALSAFFFITLARRAGPSPSVNLLYY